MNLRPLTHKQHLAEVVRHFTPNWFTMTMGTGILLLMIHAFPFAFPGQALLAHGLWWLDIGLYVLFSLLFSARLLLESDSVRHLLAHPVQSMFLGAIPMGLVPVINGGLLFGTPLWLVQTLWWLDAALAVGCGWLVPFLMFTRQRHSLEDMTAVWLLPIVASEVTASSGGYLAPHLAPAAAQAVIAASYALWAMSVPLALGVVAVVFLRLALHKLPHRAMAASSWLVLGPIGTGALALLVLGQAAGPAFAATPLAAAAQFARPFGLVAGGLLWGYGLWWWGMAWFFTLRYLREGLPFNMGWWGFTFPLGVYTAATLVLAEQTSFPVLELFGALLVLQLAGFWCVVAVRTLHGMWHGYLFDAPCLAGERDAQASVS
jgi:C4-dicarboxylate transporter/malic acid transport protein